MSHFEEQAEKGYYNRYGRWPKPHQLKKFMRHGQKSKPKKRPTAAERREKAERYELSWLSNLALAGMSSMTRVGRLGKRDSQRLAELEAKYGRKS